MARRTATTSTVAIFAAVAAFLATACAGGETESSNREVVQGARTIDVAATTFSYDPEKIRVDAGEDVTIRLHSDDVRHDFVIDGRIGHVVSASGGETAKGGLRIAKPGSYTFYCSVTGHRAAGMEGTITVR